ncbi:hypothetical protein Btru_057429 [Bulinus truncatus]|nr:hypothetical protein Btru_057429 [Bulinus truncatus]
MKLREYLRLDNVYLQHMDRDVFVTSKWKSPTFYLCWRVFWAVYHVSWLTGNLIVTSLTEDASTAKWFIYLSNWVYLLLAVECVVELAVVVLGGLRQHGHIPWRRKSVEFEVIRKSVEFEVICKSVEFEVICKSVEFEVICKSVEFEVLCKSVEFEVICKSVEFEVICKSVEFEVICPHLPVYVKVMWLLYIMSVTGSVMVCVWYWTSVHKGREITAIRFNTHGVAALYIILNMAVTCIPLRVLHFVYPVTFGVIYTLFSAVYYSLDGTSQSGDRCIYSVLDWSKPGRTLLISSLSNFVFIPIVHLVLCAVNLGLDKLSDRLTGRPAITHDQSLNSFNSEKQIVV